MEIKIVKRCLPSGVSSGMSSAFLSFLSLSSFLSDTAFVTGVGTSFATILSLSIKFYVNIIIASLV